MNVRASAPAVVILALRKRVVRLRSKHTQAAVAEPPPAVSSGMNAPGQALPSDWLGAVQVVEPAVRAAPSST